MIKDSTERGLPKRGGGGKANRVENWTPFQNSRIVRVSRAFGGKDRHSKVSTLRGLRDRRVRLSMPTAIQIYDLQEKLGLSQPSKVVDWLINAAQHEIDKLPPLQFPQNWASSSSVAAAGIGEQSQLNYGQIEQQDQFLFPVMPPSFSSYLVGTTNFGFAQFPTANFKQYVHEDEDRRVGSMRGEAEVYEDCGAVHGSNAADFFL